MKITKYNQSCLLIEVNNKRILVDPGNIGYTDEINTEWKNIDYILITHKHNDHCNTEIINEIVKRDNSKIYTSSEVANTHELINPSIVKAGDIFEIDGIKVEVTKAVHGFFTKMKYSGAEVLENIGFILDDGKKRLYITSDTINFNHNYKADVICMPFNGNGLTLGIVEGMHFIKDIDPELVLPIHMQHPLDYMNPNRELLEQSLKNEDINYKILDIGESIEV